jgi:DnaJ-class molecular chaperone
MISNPMHSAQPQKVQVKKDFDEAAFAYTVLSTPEQRQLYDELGEDHIDKGLFVQTLPYDEYTTFAPFDGDGITP